MHPALRDIAAEWRDLLVRIVAYVSGIVLLAAIVVDLMAETDPVRAVAAPNPANPWTVASRPTPAFSLPFAEFDGFSMNYEIYRHAEGGRRDLMNWTAAADEARGGRAGRMAHVQIYRPGLETEGFDPAVTDLATRLDERDGNVQAAGVIATKLGAIPLTSFDRRDGATVRQCLGFGVAFDAPRMHLSGWLCPSGNAQQVARTQIACAIDRLTLISAGGDMRLAEMFARADLKRGACGPAGQVMAQSSDNWITSLQAPQLRGRLARD
jgi:hypothetical protein